MLHKIFPFRWNETGHECYTGVIKSHVFSLKQVGLIWFTSYFPLTHSIFSTYIYQDETEIFYKLLCSAPEEMTPLDFHVPKKRRSQKALSVQSTSVSSKVEPIQTSNSVHDLSLKNQEAAIDALRDYFNADVSLKKL